MRISDWSSDVCSSDLAVGFGVQTLDRERQMRRDRVDHQSGATIAGIDRDLQRFKRRPIEIAEQMLHIFVTERRRRRHRLATDRKSVVSGTSGSGLVVLGGRRTVKQNNK